MLGIYLRNKVYMFGLELSVLQVYKNIYSDRHLKVTYRNISNDSIAHLFCLC